MSDQDRPMTQNEMAREIYHLRERLVYVQALLAASQFDPKNKLDMTREVYRKGRKGWNREMAGPIRAFRDEFLENQARARREAQELQDLEAKEGATR